LLALSAGLVTAVLITLAVQAWLDTRIDTLGASGPLFAVTAAACGTFGGLGAALAAWVVLVRMRSRPDVSG
jgi:hypothetical protein